MISYIADLEKQNERLKTELEETKAHLKRYTAPARSKKYYQENKEEHKQRVRQYKESTKYNNKYQPTEEMGKNRLFK
jgi:phage host-nuclease inhibitor protein Gam